MNYLLKLNGLRKFFNAYKAYLVQSRIDQNAREIGLQTGIWCLDDANLDTLLAGCGVEASHIDVEKTSYEKKVAVGEQQKKAFPKAVEYLKYDFWTLPNYRNIVNLIRLFKLMVQSVDVQNESHRLLAKQMAVNLGVAVSQITADVLRHDANDVPLVVLNRLLGGARERRDREVLYDTIAKLIPNQKLSVTPDFHEPLTELVLRFVNAARDACGAINCLDHLVRQSLSDRFESVWGSAEQNYGARTLKLANDVYHFIGQSTGVPLSIFGIQTPTRHSA